MEKTLISIFSDDNGEEICTMTMWDGAPCGTPVIKGKTHCAIHDEKIVKWVKEEKYD